MNGTSIQRLYLFQLGTANLPLPNGQTLSLSSGCYLVQTTDGQNILIDCGEPVDQPSPENVPFTRLKTVFELLAKIHLQPSDINTLICTHFDIDHAGNLEAFPRAELVVQRAHYELARSGHPRYATARPHWDHPALRYRLIDGDLDLLAGLRLIETSGHAPGHQSVLLRLPHTGSVLLCIDAVPIQRLFTLDRKPWPDDDNEAQLLASTRKLLQIVETEQVHLTIFHHDGAQWATLTTAPGYYE